MRIAFFELEGWEEKIILENFPADDVFLSKEKIDEFNLPERNDFEIISIFVNSIINEKVLGHFPNLKFLTTRSTGFDHIDLSFCKKRGVSVGFVPGYGNNTVAEWTFGLILNLTRKIYQAIDQIKEAESFDLSSLRGVDLKNRTIGIIGTGRIGKEMIKIAHGFGMKILAFDLYPEKQTSAELNFEYVDLGTLLKNSDIISLHAPYNEKTHHLINKNNINFIKRGAYIINTARGGILETDALVEALQKDILAGAGLDVLEEEGETKDEMMFLRDGQLHGEKLKTILENHILMKMPNVLITPHNAFNSEEALGRILVATVENIKGFMKNQPMNLVSHEN